MQSPNPKTAQELLRLLADSGALLEGDHKLKDGSRSPFYFDFGQISDGGQLVRLGQVYARAIKEQIGLDAFDIVFGPAYKGIPIATATVYALNDLFRASKGLTFNRKEAKNHGDARPLVGAQPTKSSRVLVIDDVFTSGGAKLEAIEFLTEHGNPEVVSVFVGVDRSTPDAAAAFQRGSGGMPVRSICTLADLPDLLDAFDSDFRKQIAV